MHITIDISDRDLDALLPHSREEWLTKASREAAVLHHIEKYLEAHGYFEELMQRQLECAVLQRMKERLACQKSNWNIISNRINQILCGNHLEILSMYSDGFFDMWLTSPPYDNLRDYEGYDFQFEPLARELYRVLKPGGVGVWVVNDTTVNGSETLTSAKQKIFFREVCGFTIHTMFYVKTQYQAYDPDCMRYPKVVEYVMIVSKGKPLTFHPIKDCLNSKAGKRIGKWSARYSDGTQRKEEIDKYFANESYRSNFWVYNIGNNLTTKDRIAFNHPAIFPEKLAEDHILSWSNPGDVVLDPMCGSGTTCKMAAKHGRKYVGIDIAEKYCEIARKRVALIEVQPYLFHEETVTC